ncbi:MAG: hypothetical protein ACJ78X_15020 [Myxococcales bacterium]
MPTTKARDHGGTRRRRAGTRLTAGQPGVTARTELHRCAVCAAAAIFQQSRWTDMSQMDVAHHPIPRLVLRVAPGPRQAARLLDLADEVLCLADEVILDAGDFPDDCLERIAAFVGAASAQGNVKVCGLRGSQVRQLFRLGIGPKMILVGKPILSG